MRSHSEAGCVVALTLTMISFKNLSAIYDKSYIDPTLLVSYTAFSTFSGA